MSELDWQAIKAAAAAQGISAAEFVRRRALQPAAPSELGALQKLRALAKDSAQSIVAIVEQAMEKQAKQAAKELACEDAWHVNNHTAPTECPSCGAVDAWEP